MAAAVLTISNVWAGQNYATPYMFVTIAGTPGNRGNVDGTNGAAKFYYPDGLAVGTNGNIYVVDQDESTVRQLVHVGTNWIVTTIAGSAGNSGYADGTNSNAQFNEPVGIAGDKAGNFYVTDTTYGTIRRLSPLGTNWVVTTIAGSEANPEVPGLATPMAPTAMRNFIIHTGLRLILPAIFMWQIALTM